MDDEEICATYAYAMAAFGLDATTADNAAGIFEDDQPRRAVLVVDVSPQSRYGWSFVDSVRSDRQTAWIPVVAVAADAGLVTCNRARRAGCAAVCTNKCTPDVLIAGIRAVLDRFR